MLSTRPQGARRVAPAFDRLMALYADSYHRLERMLGPVPRAGDRWLSRVDGELGLYLEVCERHRYTTFLRLTYFIEDSHGRLVADPDAQIRVYHDALQAEATHCYPGQVSQPLFGSLVPISDVVQHRWRMNLFLDRWLAYLWDQGHRPERFRPVAAVAWPQPAPDVGEALNRLSCFRQACDPGG